MRSCLTACAVELRHQPNIAYGGAVFGRFWDPFDSDKEGRKAVAKIVKAESPRGKVLNGPAIGPLEKLPRPHPNSCSRFCPTQHWLERLFRQMPLP